MRSFLENKPKTLAILLLVLIVVTAPSIRRWVLAERAAIIPSSTGNLQARNQNAFALILGEIRATAADLMFLKTERYFHSGVAYKAHMDLNKMATTGERAAKEREGRENHDHEHGSGRASSDEETLSLDEPVAKHGNHVHGEHSEDGDTHPGGVPTLIRTAAEDFRGFLGDLERETKPFRDPKLEHHVTTGNELLPWYRLMTLSDPHNLRGYMIGTMLLMQANKRHEALSFIKEGIEKNQGNPQAFRLYASLTQVHWKSGRLEKALAAARKGYQLAKAVRPPDAARPRTPARSLPKTTRTAKLPVWTDDLENDFLFLARFVPLLLEKKGELAEALRVASEVSSLAPDDMPIKQIADRLRKRVSEDKPTSG